MHGSACSLKFPSKIHRKLIKLNTMIIVFFKVVIVLLKK